MTALCLPPSFPPTCFASFFAGIALPQLEQLLGTEADIAVFRQLKELSYRTSYFYCGSFYTLDEIAGFDERGLWSFDSVWFSRHGTLVATARKSALLRPRLAAMA